MPNVRQAAEQMKWLCESGNVGYDQWERWSMNPQNGGGETDCSAMIISVLRWAGFDVGNATYTGNMCSELTKHGWVSLPPDLSTAQVGDILLNDAHHVCMVVFGSGKSAMVAQASIDENGNAHGGQAGDQTGYETNVRHIYTYRLGWNRILRYQGAQSKPAPSPTPKTDVNHGIAEDGYWGNDTTTALQAYFHTYQDGEVWHQWPENVTANPGLTGGWKTDRTELGSPLICAMQKAVHATADGILGREFVMCLQARMGTPMDGKLDGPSTCIKEMQRRLNNGTF